MNNRNKSIFSLIYQLSKSDNTINLIENKYLDNLAGVLKLTKSDIEQIVTNPKNYKLIPPPLEHERMSILYYVLFAMKIDGEINPNEEKFVYKTGLKLGFNEVMIKDMIAILKQHLHTVLPNDALISIIRKYLN